MTTHVLPGLDASNPLGYLAALGLLRVLDDHAEHRQAPRPRLGFVEQGALVAALESDLELEQIIDAILEDVKQQADNPMLQLAYTDQELVASSTQGASHDLKPPPSLARAALVRAASHRARVANLAAGCFSELVQDNNGNTKPTALHFTAGQQELLAMVEDLRSGITRKDVVEALSGPWLSQSKLPSLSWDSSVARLYALRARNPSGEKRGSVPAANWLAMQALEYFPVAVRRGALVTTRVSGGWKDSVLTWAVWSPPIEHEVIRSLQRVDPRRWSASERAARGIHTVFSSRILRSDQGGYGSFTPSAPVPPPSPRTTS